MKVKVKLGRQNLVSEEQRDAEMERLVYEEYETGMHELPALSLEIDNSRSLWAPMLHEGSRDRVFWKKSPEC